MNFDKPEPERVTPEEGEVLRRMRERMAEREAATPYSKPAPAPEYDPTMLAQGIINRHGPDYARMLGRHLLNMTKQRSKRR